MTTPPENLGVYLVATSSGRRAVVIARTAADAADALARKFDRDAGVPSGTADPAAYDVGRLGTFDPGIAGARLAEQAWPVVAS